MQVRQRTAQRMPAGRSGRAGRGGQQQGLPRGQKSLPGISLSTPAGGRAASPPAARRAQACRQAPWTVKEELAHCEFQGSGRAVHQLAAVTSDPPTTPTTHRQPASANRQAQASPMPLLAPSGRERAGEGRAANRLEKLCGLQGVSKAAAALQPGRACPPAPWAAACPTCVPHMGHARSLKCTPDRAAAWTGWPAHKVSAELTCDQRGLAPYVIRPVELRDGCHCVNAAQG